MASVIIFGPTGHVGSAVALAAHSFGASKVALAMRDPTKSIPGLTAAAEAAKPFQRVQADLSDPASVSAAVRASGATRAFIYHQHGSPDHMRSAIEALHASGVQFIVYLSTGTLPRGTDLAAASPAVNPIAWSHAQVELTLHAVYGPKGFVAVRPAFFATNAISWWGRALPTGRVGVVAPDMEFDWITQDDMGRVAAALLGAGKVQEGDEEAVFMVGPQKTTLREAAVAIGRAAFPGRPDVVVEEISAEEEATRHVANGMPPPIAKHLAETFVKLKNARANGIEWMPEGDAWDAAVATVKRYTGAPGMTLAEWIEKYKGEFHA